jgi:hypothetical protein
MERLAIAMDLDRLVGLPALIDQGIDRPEGLSSCPAGFGGLIEHFLAPQAAFRGGATCPSGSFGLQYDFRIASEPQTAQQTIQVK